MEVIIYDDRFNGNEIYVITLLIGGILLFLFTKKIFNARETLLFLLYCVFVGILLDHTISVRPIDYYDVNDNSSFEFFDFLSYLMYGPFGYFFIYFYKRLRIGKARAPIYILMWVLISLFSENVGAKLGVFHYKNGYLTFFSIPIYIGALSAFVLLYHWVQRLRLGEGELPGTGSEEAASPKQGRP